MKINKLLVSFIVLTLLAMILPAEVFAHSSEDAEKLVRKTIFFLIVSSSIGIITFIFLFTRKCKNSIVTWIKRLLLLFSLLPLALLYFIWGMRGNYHTYIWFISQDCPVCTGSGPGLMGIFLMCLLISSGMFIVYALLAFKK
jgi:hypothetical protein